MGTKSSVMLTNAVASPRSINVKKTGSLNVVLDKVTVAATDVDNANDSIYMGLIPTNAVILDVEFLTDDLDSHSTPTLAADIGLVYSGIGHKDASKVLGDAADLDVFGTAVTTFQAAKTTWTSLRCEADAVGDVSKEAWDAAGLASDPGGYFAVVIDLTTAAATAAGGDIMLKVTYLG